jgi:uncharacterized cupredoxin-like copper-binding protein
VIRILIVLAAVALLAGCGASKEKNESAKPAGPVVKTVAISEREFSLTPSTVDVSKTGTYAFKITNNGKITHSFEVEGNGVDQKTENIEPGESETLTVNLTKGGKYAIFCPIDGHRGKGMNGSLTVGSA